MQPLMSARTGSYRRRLSSLLLLLGLLLIAAGWALGAESLRAPLTQARATLFYEPVPARLDWMRVVGVSRAGETRWQAEVAFSYEIDGRSRQSRQLAWFVPGFSNREEAQTLVDELRASTDLQAWVDPREPALAVLDAAPPAWRAWRRPAPWLGCMLLGALLVLRGVRGRSTRR